MSLTLSAAPLAAETVVATRVLRAHTLLGPSDVGLSSGTVPGSFDTLADVIGQETRVTIYTGRPLRHSDIGPPALVDRNQIVTLSYRHGTIGISTEGRALGRGGVGDQVRVMNLHSRAAVTGRVGADGSIIVTP